MIRVGLREGKLFSHGVQSIQVEGNLTQSNGNAGTA